MRTYRYIPLYYFYWSLYNYAADAADIVFPTTVVQGVDNHSWGLYCRRCYCIRICWGRSSRIFHFSGWLGQLSSPNQGWESTHRLHLYPLGGVFYSPQHRALGRRDLNFTSHPNDDGEPWERFSESRPMVCWVPPAMICQSSSNVRAMVNEYWKLEARMHDKWLDDMNYLAVKQTSNRFFKSHVHSSNKNLVYGIWMQLIQILMG